MSEAPDNAYDVVIIGSGTTGSTVAHRCRDAGWTVAVVDDRPFGGTCALRGCEPKKTLVEAARAVDDARRHDGAGVRFDGGLDWPELMEFKRSFTDPMPAKKIRSFEEAGIATLHGTAWFRDPTTLEVDGETYSAEHVVIATGAEPMILGMPGEEHVTLSDEFLELEELPDDIVFIGGGYITHEFAHVAARAGSRVRILEMQPRPLGAFDGDMVEVLMAASESAGIDYGLEVEVRGIEETEEGLIVHFLEGGRRNEIETDLVVHGAGRVPRTASLGLEEVGIAADESGIEVDERLRSTSYDHVYAGGDVVPAGPPLTPVANHHGEVIAENLVGQPPATVDHTGVPSVVFTMPPLASVGMTEREALDRGADFKVKTGDTAEWANNRRARAEHAAYKLLVDGRTEQVLGAHLVGPEADEVINLFAVAMQGDVALDDLQEMFLAYPTSGYDLRYM